MFTVEADQSKISGFGRNRNQTESYELTFGQNRKQTESLTAPSAETEAEK